MRTSLDLERAVVLLKFLFLWYMFLVSVVFGVGELVIVILDGQVSDNTISLGMLLAFLSCFSVGGLWFTCSLFRDYEN